MESVNQGPIASYITEIVYSSTFFFPPASAPRPYITSTLPVGLGIAFVISDYCFLPHCYFPSFPTKKGKADDKPIATYFPFLFNLQVYLFSQFHQEKVSLPGNSQNLDGFLVYFPFSVLLIVAYLPFSEIDLSVTEKEPVLPIHEGFS